MDTWVRASAYECTRLCMRACVPTLVFTNLRNYCINS